ncbi:small subunit ribosomal protein S8 [Mycoplasmoides fastidiosum]|uniref:Small ribosomal subunit protein uS8 n=1 Tax=Mycoplasmoides fastidiosum TaxID=92758 RepID=A0ABU0LY64_9BACT|nr:30S ribosomal protein S8 [Mycoplasmoides fastidiosum]MDQ0513620.1 small subunit ribosomal protein S8 [Mycoplasmoides fastidiosum]UUD37957.1 30S ribosomal protein S8 [Mycoplasmoides fastidiosum]
MYTDPISDLLVQIKMGIKAHKTKIKIAGSKLKLSVVTLLKAEGYILDFKSETRNKKNQITIFFKYRDGVASINGVRQISKPGLRVYVQADNLPNVLNGLGIAIISTNKGLMCSKHARKLQIGGEVLAYVW